MSFLPVSQLRRSNQSLERTADRRTKKVAG
jgi:hypothetical protein